MKDDDDLLGSWGSSAPAAAPAAAAPVVDDLLGSWGAAAEPPPAGKKVLSLTVHPKGSEPKGAEPKEDTLSESVNRMVGEHQGDGWLDALARLAGGAARGVGDVADTMAEGIGYAGEKGARGLKAVGAIAPETAAKVADWRSRINQSVRSDQEAFDTAAGGSTMAAAGRLGGQVAGTAPFLGIAGRAAMAPVNALTRLSPELAQVVAQPSALMRAGQIVGAGAAGGAGAAALTSSTSDESLPSQVSSGALTGGVLGPLGYGLGRAGSAVLGSGLDPATARLAQAARDQYGIPISAGQMSSNPTIRFMDSVLQRLPLTGYGARTEQQLAGINREVASTFGEHTDAINPDTIRAAKQRLGGGFNAVAARTGHIAVDPQGASEMVRIMQDAASAPENVTDAVRRQIRNIVSAVDPVTRSLSPEAYQALTRKGAPLNLAQKGGERTVAHYANQLREVIDDMMERSAPPDVAHDLATLRSQWRAMKTIEPLAEKAGPEGISPALLRSAVNKNYPNTARAPGGNEATLRDLAQIGQRFIKEPPSSGTAERTMIMQHMLPAVVGGAGLGGLGIATAFDPDSWQRNALIAAGTVAGGRAGAAALRSNALANAVIRSGLRGRGAAGNPLQALIDRTLPAAGALAYREPRRLAAPLQ